MVVDIGNSRTCAVLF
ncbi:MAG: hypothetical protein IPK21_07680 [Haliscomenobacter sp.]|nr:hypothetical protein [Haliscomenobacter sp.]